VVGPGSSDTIGELEVNVRAPGLAPARVSEPGEAGVSVNGIYAFLRFFAASLIRPIRLRRVRDL
jgi:hypothetical protein